MSYSGTRKKLTMARPQAFYYEDYNTKTDPEYLYHKDEADREFERLEKQLRERDMENVRLSGWEKKFSDEAEDYHAKLATALRLLREARMSSPIMQFEPLRFTFNGITYTIDPAQWAAEVDALLSSEVKNDAV
jgi:hypothetical protein